MRDFDCHTVTMSYSSLIVLVKSDQLVFYCQSATNCVAQLAALSEMTNLTRQQSTS